MKSRKPSKEIKGPIENAKPQQNGLSEAILGYDVGSIGTQLSQVDTLFKNNRWYLLSNMRQVLSEMYCEHGLVQTVVDVPVDDGLRGGVSIKSKQLSEDQVKKLEVSVDQDNDLNTLGQAAKWNRLFGGAGTLIITDQDASTPLNLSAIGPDSVLEFRAVDMWELFYDRQNTEGYNASLDSPEFEYYNYYGQRVHRSRVLLLKGLVAPSFVRPRLRGWGFSIIEALVRSINQYLKANNLTFEVLDEFKVDIFKIKNLANTLLSPNGAKAVQNRVAIANAQKNFQSAITMDSEDDFLQKELSFTGLAEVMVGIRMQIASDLRMPLTKVFGISAAGFSSGQDDIENYNAMVESQVRSKLKYQILQVLELKCQKLFQFVPDDLEVEFKPLRMLSAEQEENVKNAKFTRLLQAKQAGEISSKEFKEGCNKDNLLPITLDPSVDTLPTEQFDPEQDAEVADDAPKSKIAAKEVPKLKNDYPNPYADFDGPQIVTVGLVCNNEILTGKRRDNGLWTSPGGHIDDGESIEAAACREVFEESGILIHPSQLQLVRTERVTSHRTGKDFIIHGFIARVDKATASAKNDPDDEISKWKWVELDPNAEELRAENRHAKVDMILDHLFKSVV